MANVEVERSTTSRWDPSQSLTAIAICILVGLAVVVVQALQLDTWAKVVSQVATMLAVSGAATMLGGLGGFLFGIPRRLQNEQQPPKRPAENADGDTNEPLLYEGNTNLEQISDWLTKIIVGVTLVKLADIVTELETYGGKIASATGRPSDSAFAVGLMIFFFVCGFLTGYLWSRLFLGRALTEAESKVRLQKKLNRLQQQAATDAEAIGLARQLLSGETKQQRTAEEIARIFADASRETISHIFSLAENNRWRNWESNKTQMERSIPIFEALILLDPQANYHRNIGQLAYCIKDKKDPNWKEAEALFTRAIASRGDQAENGWAAYEANRAISRIKLGPEMIPQFGAADELAAAIAADLNIAFQDYWVTQWLSKDQTVREWAKETKYELP
jgi:hypothetical protein